MGPNFNRSSNESRFILVAHDNAQVLTTIRTDLLKVGYSNLFLTRDLTEALEQVRSSQVDLVITEFTPTGESWGRFYETCRNDKNLKKIKFLLFNDEKKIPGNAPQKFDILTQVISSPWTREQLKKTIYVLNQKDSTTNSGSTPEQKASNKFSPPSKGTDQNKEFVASKSQVRLKDSGLFIHRGEAASKKSVVELKDKPQSSVNDSNKPGDLGPSAPVAKQFITSTSQPLYFSPEDGPIPEIQVIPDRVLIVDADMAVMQLIENYLKSIGAKECNKFTSALEAWNTLHGSPHDLVIMDWKQKDLSGLKLYNRIRGNRSLARTPIIVTAGFAHKEDFRIISESTYSAFLEKPVQLTIFVREVNKIMQSARDHSEILRLISFRLPMVLEKNEDLSAVIREILEKAPDPQEYLLATGQYLAAKGRLEDAEKALKVAYKLKPDSLSVMTELGKIFHRTNRPKDAMRILEKANSLAPGGIDRLCLLGEVGLNLQNVEEARKYFKEALEIDEEHPIAVAGAKVGENIAEHLESQGVKSLTSQFASTLNIVGLTLIKNNELQKGIDQYQSAMVFTNNSPALCRLQFNLGMAYLRGNQLDDAEKWFRASLEFADPGFVKPATYLEKIGLIRAGKLKLSETQKEQSDFESIAEDDALSKGPAAEAS